MAEIGRHRRQARIDRLDLFLLRRGQLRAGVDHALVGFLEQLGVLGVEGKGGALFVNRFHPREECRVERDRIRVRSQSGADFGIDRVERVIVLAPVSAPNPVPSGRHLAHFRERRRVLEVGFAGLRARGDFGDWIAISCSKRRPESASEIFVKSGACSGHVLRAKEPVPCGWRRRAVDVFCMVLNPASNAQRRGGEKPGRLQRSSPGGKRARARMRLRFVRFAERSFVEYETVGP